MAEITLYDQFIEDVSSGRLVTGQKIRLMVQRHLSDLDRDDLYFDRNEADKHISFIKLIPLVDGEWAGKLIPLQPWQAFLIASIYGWKWKHNNKRRYTQVYLQVAKKNAKTATSAIIALDNSITDKVPGAQVYFAGFSKETADICFTMTKKMAEAMMSRYPSFSAICKLWAQSVEFTNTATFLKKVSSEAKNLEGKGAKCAIIDEVHTHPNSDVIDNMRSGMALYDDPLMVLITTAGVDKTNIAYKLYNLCSDVLNGVKVSDNLFAMIWEIDKDDDWKDKSVWPKSNPNIGESPKWGFLEQQFNDALNLGGRKEVDFKIKHLNLWVDADVTWISDEAWMRGQEEWEDFTEGSMIYAGLDLASTRDFSALCIMMDVGGTKYMQWKYYVSETFIKNAELEDLRQWARDGYITVTPGNTTDYNFIQKDILELAEKFDLQVLHYDRYNANQLIVNLEELGINCLPLAQTFSSMHVPTEAFEKAILDGQIQHNGNPVTRWMMANAQVITNEYKQMRISKKKSKGPVDGPVAATMAIAAQMSAADGGYAELNYAIN